MNGPATCRDLRCNMNNKNQIMQLDGNELYEAALKQRSGLLARRLYSLWVVTGLTCLIGLGWFEPFSGWLFEAMKGWGMPSLLIDFLAVPIVMVLRAVLLVEAIGYMYHRFFQHVGFMTRRSGVIRRNQRFHWIHHMIIYPIGRLYRRAVKYVPSERGFSLSWVLPGLIVAGLFVLTHGLNLGSVVFVAALGWYAKFVVDRAHSRFHEVNHPWAQSPYFHKLEKIHLLHHWDQRTNFTIVHPLMDQLFGTYLSPEGHERELQLAMEDRELTVSDLINWRYLLIEASPAEYAAFVSAAKRYSRSIKKVNLLIKALDERLACHADDRQAAELRHKALALLTVIGKQPVAA